MFNSTEALSYKTINVFNEHRKEIFFIADPPHLLKTIRNCFASGKLWVCKSHFQIHLAMYIFLILSLSVLGTKLIGT